MAESASGKDSWLKDLKNGNAFIGIAVFFLLLHDYIFWSIMDGFKNLEIKSFRGVEHMMINDFLRVNVFWGDLDAEYLGALKGFLERNLSED